MRWLSKKVTEKTDKRLKDSKRHEEEARQSYDRMMRSLKDLEDLLDATPVDRRSDSQRG